MDNHFKTDEKLYRAVYDKSRKPNYWKRDGTLSPAALFDEKGLSVDRGYYREDCEVLADMSGRLKGLAISVRVGMCNEVNAIVRHKPSKDNLYHSEIHGSKTDAVLSPEQRLYLAKCAIVVGTIPKK